MNDWVKHMNGNLLFHNKPPFLRRMGGQPMRLFFCRDAGGYGLVHYERLGMARVGTALIV